MAITWTRGARLISLFDHTINYSPSFRATTIFTNHLHPSHAQCRFFNCSSSSSPSSSPSSNKLFVGGLSWSVDEKSLKEAFSSFGQVTEVKIVYDKDSGRARGFGFVIFSNELDAKSAKDAMDGKALLGRPLRINFALEKARGVPVVVPRFSDIGNLNSFVTEPVSSGLNVALKSSCEKSESKSSGSESFRDCSNSFGIPEAAVTSSLCSFTLKSVKYCDGSYIASLSSV